MNVPLPEPGPLFTGFHADCTSDGAARDRFESFVLDLVNARWDGATTVSARNHNDWGIDAFVGDLGGGAIRVWQSKYFREWQTTGPQQEVRDSFASAQKQAQEQGHSIIEWTLVVPSILHPAQMRWFAGWAKRQQNTTKTRVRLWQGDELRRQLMSRETFDVRREYFPRTLPVDARPPAEEPAVAMTDDYSVFDEALFVRQLKAAGHVETGAACGMFFATDALRRDLEARRADHELRALQAVQLGVHNTWDLHFNELIPSANDRGQMPTLYRSVISEVTAVPDAPGLVLQPAHKQGAVHLLVEEGRAGWVRDWRVVATEHVKTDVDLMDVAEPDASTERTAPAVQKDRARVSTPATTDELRQEMHSKEAQP